jgi:hypothetical protein
MTEALPSRGSTFLGWVVLGLILAAFPLQAAWFVMSGAEPYPALAQPPFKSVPDAAGVLVGETLTVSVVRSDGSVVPIDADDIFPETWNQGPYVIESIMLHPKLDEGSQRQLLGHLNKFVPAGDIAYLKIESQAREYRLRDSQLYPTSNLKTTLVDLRYGARYAS